MKFYRHYKNKPYKYIGVARHSETQEDLVLYECRYDNPGAMLWVRPKDLFFETISLEGQVKPRFEQMKLQIDTYTDLKDSEVAILGPLIEKTFGDWDSNWFYGRLRNHTRFHLLVGSIEGEAIAFKLGYELDQQNFYSWLGGVVPEYQGVGIASDLMEKQHEWCREQGYLKVQTKTQNRFRKMLMLNLKFGFNVIGTHASDEGGDKIILEKNLKKDEPHFATDDSTSLSPAKTIKRPDFIKHYLEIQEPDDSHYPDSEELLSIGSPFAKTFGLTRLGIHHEVLPPGRRTSWPHAESEEEEFVYVIEGHPDVWIDGNLHPLQPGDGVGFKAGTGTCHTFLNNTGVDVRLLVVGEATKKTNRCFYALDPKGNERAKLEGWLWENPPRSTQGDHDGIPEVEGIL